MERELHLDQAPLDETSKPGSSPASNRACGHRITHPATIDSLAFHLGLLGVTYLLTHGYLSLAQLVVIGTPIENIFGYNLFFFHGLMICVVIRRCLDRFGMGTLVDDETQKRITGSAVDVMVTATLVTLTSGYSCSSGHHLMGDGWCHAVAAALCLGAGYRLKRFGMERGLTSFGCCCGSTGTGILLLRILDPQLSSPVAKELAFSTSLSSF